MLPQYKRNTNIGVGFGILLQVAGRMMAERGSPEVGLIVALAGVAIFIWGCGQYAKGKGHSMWFGALGLLSVIGLVILVVMSDKHKNAQ